MGDGQLGKLLGNVGGQHVGDGVLGAPVARHDQADALFLCQQGDMVRSLAGDKTVRTQVDGLL